jgi:ribosomal protein L17
MRRSCPTFGWIVHQKYINIHVQRKPFNKIWKGPPFKEWHRMKGFLDKLIREQRIDVKNPLAKEVQQYAEEVVWRAKQNTPFHDNVVESMLISPEARQVLYEHLVPRYAHRPFFFTRIQRHWTVRFNDSAHLSTIEFVDRPGELRPARPDRADRPAFVLAELETRRGRRRYRSEALKLGLLDSATLAVKAQFGEDGTICRTSEAGIDEELDTATRRWIAAGSDGSS